MIAVSRRLPSGTVTFLLTDIEGSTLAWERDATATAVAVTRHYEILDQVIAAHRGHRPVEQGEGDSTVSAFTTASDAVAAALAAQRELTAAGVSVRMAVHTGEIELRDEGNYFGPTIIRCARLRATAHGGQVVVSDATRSLVHDRLPSGASLRDLGEHRLKDLDNPERVWQLCHDDLEAEFPWLRSLDSYGHNLPTRLTSLIGREADTAAVMAALRDSRLVTLVGTGGVGKTRLGLQVAAQSIGRFDGGVWWVDLATVSDPASVPGAVLAAIGVPAQPGRRPVQILGEQVGDRSTMFVLDNCEHVIAASASFVDELLTELPTVTVLATSREPLSVPGETVWRVPSLDVPDAVSPSIGSVERSDATRLFLDRAVHVRSDLVLTDGAADAIVRICRRLDGIPLSIELAAARCRSLTVEQIARELDDRFRLLTGGARTVMERQQTLKASIDWSHDLLGTAERVALRRIGVFIGPFTIGAAEAVISSFGDVESIDVLDLVEQLVDKSLLSVEGADAAGDSRFRLLETLRYYAIDRLADAGEVGSARDSHADYWADWAGAHDVHADCGLATSDLIPENLPNLSAAARWACASRPGLVQPLIMCIGSFLQLEGDDVAERATEGLLELALAAVKDDEVAWAHVAMATAFAYLYAGVVRPGFIWSVPSSPLATHEDGMIRRVAAIAERHDLSLVRALTTFVFSATQTSDPAGWTAAGSLFEEAGNPSWASLSRAMGVRFLAATGRIVEAEEAMRTPMASGDTVRMMAIGGEAQVAVVRGRLAGIVQLGREAADLELPRSSTLFVTAGLAYEALARAAFFAGDRDVLAWAAQLLERVARTRISRRYAAIALAYRYVADGAERGEPPEEWIPAAVLAGMRDSVTGGGLLQRESAYLAVATADVAWIAAERVNIERFAAGDNRATCFLSMCDAVVAQRAGHDRSAEQHWHLMLAIASENGFGLLWIDALEGLAICAARAGENEIAARLAGATDAARNERRYRYHYPHIAELPTGSDEGRALSLEEVTAWVRRSRGERARPTTGWASLTPTEAEVARAVAHGLTNQQVAQQLFVSVPTVKTHLRHIFAKLAIDNRAKLVAVAAQHDR